MSLILVGSPNSGKTTLFNRLTGLSAKTVNYPGSTVDLHKGRLIDNPSITVIDTPGVYSLVPRSPDEAVTVRALCENGVHKSGQDPDDGVEIIVAVIDATQLSRQLALALQLKKFGETKHVPVIIAITMLDILKKSGESVDLVRLSKELGLPVISVPWEEKMAPELLLVSAIVEIHGNPPAKKSSSNQSSIDQTPLPDFDIVNDLRESQRLKNLVVVGKKNPHSDLRARTRKIDRLALHPIAGPFLFASIMAGIFTLVFWIAAPFMDLFELAFQWPAQWILGLSWVDPESVLVRLLTDGIFAGAGAVMVFVPQIFILFLGLVILEDSGYLARAASIVDQPLKKVGLGGRSFVPLLSGFACAVPAMLATRTINSRSERLVALFVIPLMSCSARLPVYALLLAFLFAGDAWTAGFVLTGLYLSSVVAGVIAAGVLSWMIRRKGGDMAKEKSFLLLELPLYRRPRPRMVLHQAWLRTGSYIKRTGPVILLLSVLIWAGTTFPHYQTQDPVDRLEHSYAGKLGKYMTPVFEPMGGDWRTGLGLISAFAAREVFVATMAVIFHVTDEDESRMQDGLLGEMKNAKNRHGEALFTTASIAGLLVFFVIALQCLSTFAVAIKESGSLGFAIRQLVVMNVAAYVLAVIVVQGLKAIGIS
ncbi:MAG: ferrous iron transport protein B [Bdellovibrionales bacterium]|nr:ferrous iron transport protein B [Bdellovibrionales bacterium]